MKISETEKALQDADFIIDQTEQIEDVSNFIRKCFSKHENSLNTAKKGIKLKLEHLIALQQVDEIPPIIETLPDSLIVDKAKYCLMKYDQMSKYPLSNC